MLNICYLVAKNLFISFKMDTMQIYNQQSNNNFTGAFRFRPSEIKAKLEVPQLFTQGRQVGSDILEKGDQIIIVRDNYDKRIGNYIKENGITSIEYYPTINTKLGLDFERPEEIIAILKDKSTRLITNLEEMFDAISKQKHHKKTPKCVHIPKPVNPEKELERVTKALRLNIQNPEITVHGQHMRIYDKDKKRTLDVVLHSGTYYTYLRYDNMSTSSIMRTINGKGETIKNFERPNEIHKFLEDLRRLIKENSTK